MITFSTPLAIKAFAAVLALCSVGNFYAGEQFCFGFIGGDDADVGENAVVQ